jgi:hypothetical protein
MGSLLREPHRVSGANFVSRKSQRELGLHGSVGTAVQVRLGARARVAPCKRVSMGEVMKATMLIIVEHVEQRSLYCPPKL